MKYSLLTIIIYIMSLSTVIGQSNTKGYAISLDPNLPTNQNHPYIDYFVEQDEEYIVWLYVTNVINAKNTPEYSNPAIIIDDKEGNNSLVFTLKGKDGIRYDTLRNSIHDFRDWKIEQKSFVSRILDRFRSCGNNFEQDLQGHLPEGSMIWKEDKNWGLKFGVLVPENDDMVEILIKDLQGRTVTKIIDRELRKGWNNFKWKRGHHPRGIYNLSISINGQTMTQNFES